MKNTHLTWLLACCWLLSIALPVPARAAGTNVLDGSAVFLSQEARSGGKPSNWSLQQAGDTTKASPAKALFFDLWSELTAITPRALPPGEVKPGSRLAYTIRFRNAGTDTIRNLKVIDYAPNKALRFNPGLYTGYVNDTILLPPGPTKLLSKDINTVTVSGQALLDTVAWEFDVIPPSPDTSAIFAITLEVQVSDSINRSLTLTNLVRFQFSGFGDQKTVDVALRLAPKIEFTKHVNPNVLYPDDEGTFTIQYRNVGDRPSDNEVIQDILPSGIAYVDGSVFSSDGQAFDLHKGQGGQTDTLIWRDPLIPNNKTIRTVGFKFRASVEAVLQPA